MALTKIGKEGITGISNSSDANAITIDSSENVAIGSSDPQGFQLQVNTGAAGNIARFTDGVNANTVIKTSGSVTTFGPDTTNSLVLQTNSIERVNINTSGLAQFRSSGISAGNQVFQVIDDGATLFQIRAEDGNISFPQSGAGIYLGVTAGNAANLLNDYEEGTWTPDIRNADNPNTFTTEDGTYTKIGNRVCVTFRNDNGSTGGGGSVQIRNLPFSHDGHFSVVGLAGVNGGSLTNRQYNVTANSGTTFHLYNGGSIDSQTFSYVSGFAVYITNS